MENDLISRAHVKALVNGMWWDTIDSIPAVDAVEVVRCPSCRYHIDDGYHECIEFGIRIPDDAEFFCKYGKRKEEEGEV